MFCVSFTSQSQCPLLTGDLRLRRTAEKEAIIVQGTLWLIEQIVIHKIITIQTASSAYEKMKQAGRRLPWDIAKQRLADLVT